MALIGSNEYDNQIAACSTRVHLFGWSLCMCVLHTYTHCVSYSYWVSNELDLLFKYYFTIDFTIQLF